MRWSRCVIPTWLKGAQVDGVEDIIMGYFIILMSYYFASFGRLTRMNSIPTPVLWFRTAGSVMMLAGALWS